jgi:hypothetical protein
MAEVSWFNQIDREWAALRRHDQLSTSRSFIGTYFQPINLDLHH